MESECRAVNQESARYIPQSLNDSYFAAQARRAGYMGPEIVRTQLELHRVQHHPYDLHPHPMPFHHPLQYLLPHPHDMYEAIQREIEKERIREEIIMSEIVRRRALQAEVRRELELEGKLLVRRTGGDFLFGSSSKMEFDSPVRLVKVPSSGTRAGGNFLEERNGLDERHESGGFSAPPQTETMDPTISEPKPGGSMSGSKRKAVTPPEVHTTELASNEVLKKKAKAEWSCALCQVSATSEQGFNEHLQGKKHKSKEAVLRAHRAGKNYSIKLLSNKAANDIEIVGNADPAAEKGVTFAVEPKMPTSQKQDPSSFQDKPKTDELKKNEPVLVHEVQKKAANDIEIVGNADPAAEKGETFALEPKKPTSRKQDPSSLQDKPNTDELKKNEPVLVHEVQKKGGHGKQRFRFWCELCKVGTYSQKVMIGHKAGKKHTRQLQGSDRNQDGKNVTSEIVRPRMK